MWILGKHSHSNCSLRRPHKFCGLVIHPRSSLATTMLPPWVDRTDFHYPAPRLLTRRTLLIGSTMADLRFTDIPIRVVCVGGWLWFCGCTFAP